LLSSQEEFHYKAKAFASLVHNNQYSQAFSYLNSLVTSSQGEIDYVRVQNLNLQRLQGNEENTLAESEIDELRIIAEKTHPYHANAHSLLHLVTGEDIYYDLPDPNDFDQSTGRSKNEKEVIIYPNPFMHNIVVETTGISSMLGKIYV